MAEYREIQGQAVQSLSSSTGTIEGQIWYDNANGLFKLIAATSAGSWATGGSLAAGRQSAAQAGIQTAAILAGGQTPSAYTTDTSYTYDGSSWTSTPSLGTARRTATMFGTQTAAVLASSTASSPPQTAITGTEEWGGSSWTAGGAMNTARYGSYAGGTLTQGVVAGGSGPPGYKNNTEEYNGTSWTSVTNMPQNYGTGTSGSDSQLSMNCVAGGPGNQTTNLVYDGTNWTTGNALSGSGRRGTGGAMPSSSSPGFVTGGETSTVNPITTTEEYDGTSFSSSTAIPSAHRDFANADGGTGAAGLVSGGHSSTAISNTVFEWTGSGIAVTKTITTS
tara:strand:+ start:72 stop:1076 length:1005 start_codon:yes stop_codon:yes gene_type:complete